MKLPYLEFLRRNGIDWEVVPYGPGRPFSFDSRKVRIKLWHQHEPEFFQAMDYHGPYDDTDEQLVNFFVKHIADDACLYFHVESYEHWCIELGFDPWDQDSKKKFIAVGESTDTWERFFDVQDLWYELLWEVQ